MLTQEERGARRPVEIRTRRPWVELFDEILAVQARVDYGFVPDLWLEARSDLAEVDGGEAVFVMDGTGVFLKRGEDLRGNPILLTLLRRLHEAGIPLESTQAAPTQRQGPQGQARWRNRLDGAPKAPEPCSGQERDG